MLLELPDARFNAAGSPGEVLPVVKKYKQYLILSRGRGNAQTEAFIIRTYS